MKLCFFIIILTMFVYTGTVSIKEKRTTMLEELVSVLLWSWKSAATPGEYVGEVVQEHPVSNGLMQQLYEATGNQTVAAVNEVTLLIARFVI